MKRNLNIPADIENVARMTVDAVFHVHKEIGPGLLESVYAACLAEEMRYRGIRCSFEVPVPLDYRGRRLDLGFRLDCVVENRLLVELKAVEHVLPVHLAQVITCLKLTRRPRGLLVNLNVPFIKDGITRVFNPTLA